MKYVSGVIAFILFIIVAIFGVRLVVKQINSINTTTPVSNQLKLSELKQTGVKIRYTVKGPIVADENHRELVFEVGQGNRSVKLMKGYNQTLLKEQNLSNNYNAYSEFATAVYATGLMSERTALKDAKYEGTCPSGNLYTAELIGADSKVIKSLWRVSCDTKQGNFNASPTTALSLFKKQFPEYLSFSTDITID